MVRMGNELGQLELEFDGPIWFWRGPAPWYFVTVPDQGCRELRAAAAVVSYGWGMVPVTASIERTRWVTSLWPKDGRYIVPIKASVRKTERLELDDTVRVRLTVEI